MKRRKILVVLLSLALVVGVFAPGTLTASADPVESSSEVSVSQKDTADTSASCTVDAVDVNDENHEAVTEDSQQSDNSETDNILQEESAFSDVTDSSENSEEASQLSSDQEEESSQTGDFDVQTAYEYLKTLSSRENFNAYLDTLSNEEVFSLLNYLEEQNIGEDSLPYMTDYLQNRFPSEDFLTCQNDVNAAPLYEPLLPIRRLDAAPKQGSGIETSKTVIKNTDGTYKLRLEAYATGSTYTQITQKPTDIVLVLDTSGSMDEYITEADKNTVADLDPQYANYCMWETRFGLHQMIYLDGKWQYKWQYNIFFGWTDCGNSIPGNAVIKKIDALRISVNGFLTSVESQGGDNKVALVTFATGATMQSGLTSDYNSIRTAVNGLSADGATYAEEGMQQAEDIINNIDPTRESNKVVIMFTDGQPTHQRKFDSEVANDTITASKDMKDKGVTVYTIGVMEGADSTKTDDFNKYMNYVSSNYPNANSLTDGGQRYQSPSGGGYYLTADNLATLSQIFQNISSEVGGASNKTLDSTSVIKDIVAESFQLPEGADAGNIRVFTADCTAITNDVPIFGPDQDSDLTAQIGEDGRTISVTGFDYSANYVGMNTTTGDLHQPGKKLIVEIPITMREGFLGGNQIPTNGTDSGVYNNKGESVQAFDVPNVDIDIQKVTVTAEEKNIYLLGGLTLDQIKQGATVKVGDVALDLTADNYGLETWQNAYVNIDVIYEDANGNTLTDLSSLKEDTTYKVTVTVSPKTGATTENTKSGNSKGNINVFKPELTNKDSEVYYGDTVPSSFDRNFVTTEWKHGGTTDTSVTMIGTTPDLKITYTLDASSIADGRINSKKDIPVAVTTAIGEMDVTSYTSFHHQACTDRTDNLPNGAVFLLHVNTCQLTLTKTGGAADEPYVFTVLKDGKAYTQVSITGNGSKTIYELSVGTYSIEEDSGWSWRYQSTVSGNAGLSAVSPTGSITCSNRNTEVKWLNGFSTIVTNIFGKSSK